MPHVLGDNYLARLTVARKTHVAIRRLSDGGVVALLTLPPVRSTALSPARDVLAFGTTSSSIHLFDALTREHTGTGDGHRGWVSALAFSPDGAGLAAASDGRVAVHDGRTGKKVRSRDLSRGGTGDSLVRALSWSPDGAQLWLHFRARFVALDAATLATVVDEGTDCESGFLVAVDTHRVLVSPVGRLGLLDATSGAVLAELPLPPALDVRSAALHPSHSFAVVLAAHARTRAATLCAVGLDPLVLLGTVGLTGQVCEAGYDGGVAFTPDGSEMIVACADQTYRVSVAAA